MTPLPNGWYLYAAPKGAKMVSKKKFDDFLSNEVFADLNKIGRENLYDLRQPFVKPNRDGYFKKGDNKGLWNFHYKSGQLYFTGRYRNQLKEGIWEYYYENGQLICKGNYREGKEIGEWRFHHENGNSLINISFVNGLVDGYGELFHENGQIACKGSYILDNPDGFWEYYDDHGTLTERKVFDNGVQLNHEVFEPVENGTQMQESNTEESKESL